ncbi:MAG TPA: hypothetical protein VH950_16490 [Gaiellaceae bacterium]|jgi:hypothetical protein
MKAAWQGRLGQTAARYGEHAPMAGVCCNACRTCVSTNVLSLGLAAVLGAGAAAVKLSRRLGPSAAQASDTQGLAEVLTKP